MNQIDEFLKEVATDFADIDLLELIYDTYRKSGETEIKDLMNDIIGAYLEGDRREVSQLSSRLQQLSKPKESISIDSLRSFAIGYLAGVTKSGYRASIDDLTKIIEGEYKNPVEIVETPRGFEIHLYTDTEHPDASAIELSHDLISEIVKSPEYGLMLSDEDIDDDEDGTYLVYELTGSKEPVVKNYKSRRYKNGI